MSDRGPDPDAAGWELASAYVDDEADGTVRAQVEASAELRAMVAELRDLRAGLGIAPVATPAVREAAIAAALLEFDAGRADETAAGRHPGPFPAPDTSVSAAGDPRGTTPAVVHELAAQRRRRRYTWITGAAAAAIVVIVGVVALKGSDSSNTDLAVSKPPATTDAAPTAAGNDSRAVAAQPAPETTNGAATAASATVAASATTSAAASATTAASPTNGDAAASGGAPPAAAGTAPIPHLTSPDELLDLPRPETASASAASTAATNAATASTTVPPGQRCVAPSSVVLGLIDYQGIPAIAVVDDARRVRQAIELADCAVLAQVPDTP